MRKTPSYIPNSLRDNYAQSFGPIAVKPRRSGLSDLADIKRGRSKSTDERRKRAPRDTFVDSSPIQDDFNPRRQRPPHPPRPVFSLTGAHTVWSPSITRDVTIHFELDIADDLEDLLEEFSRLKRLGHFRTAEKYFQASLHEFAEFPPVKAEYADMLLEQGDHKRLHEMELRAGPLDTDPRLHYSEDFPEFLCHANYELIQAHSAIASGGFISDAHRKARMYDGGVRTFGPQQRVHVNSAHVRRRRPRVRN
jgi:hypothetical protein